MAVIYEHPLAYLLGLEGLALLRGFVGEYDRDVVEARVAEVRGAARRRVARRRRGGGRAGGHGRRLPGRAVTR
jgi:hypothetical protein